VLALGYAMIVITQRLDVLFSFQEEGSWKEISGWASG
jgi:hypothetical protein